MREKDSEIDEASIKFINVNYFFILIERKILKNFYKKGRFHDG